jgi:prevent-host-death family protein
LKGDITMAETTMSAFDARRKFGKVLDAVTAKGTNVIVERHGEPVAVIIPIADYRKSERLRDQARARFFECARQIAERANLDPEEAEALVAESVEEVRAAQAALRARASHARHGV